MIIAEAKHGLRIPELWRRLELPGTPAKSCKSPLREDRSASFSVSVDGLLFNDFATGEAGDAVDFLRLATGLSQSEACRRFLEMAGGGSCSPLPVRESPPAAPRQKPSFPAFESGTDAELHALAELRRLSFTTCFVARGAGLLHFATLRGFRAWVLTDNARLNAQARRLDGKPWEHIGGKKAWTLPGSWASWPLGLGTGLHYSKLLLCEGGPDFLAALDFNERKDFGGMECFPLAMIGASLSIHADALPLLAGKRIRIFPHLDKEGRDAVERWAGQLEAVGAEVDCFNFSGLRKADGEPVGDLNDCTLIHPDDATELDCILP